VTSTFNLTSENWHSIYSCLGHVYANFDFAEIFCFPVSSPYGTLVTLSVTLMRPAKAGGQNEMPFGRDNGVVPSRGMQNPMRMSDIGFLKTEPN